MIVLSATEKRNSANISGISPLKSAQSYWKTQLRSCTQPCLTKPSPRRKCGSSRAKRQHMPLLSCSAPAYAVAQLLCAVAVVISYISSICVTLFCSVRRHFTLKLSGHIQSSGHTVTRIFSSPCVLSLSR